MRSLLAGFTDYSHQSLRDISGDLADWIKSLKETLKSNSDFIAKFENKDYLKTFYDFYCTYMYTVKFFDTCVEELTIILGEMDKCIKQTHITRLFKIGGKSVEISNDLGKIWHSDNNPEMYGDKDFKILEKLYADSRDMCNDMIDISNCAHRLEDFIEASLNNKVEVDTSQLLNGVWVIESEEDMIQGTAFMLSNYGMVSCCHVIGKDMKAFRANDISKKYSVSVLHKNPVLDLAILKIEGVNDDYHYEMSNSVDDMNQLDKIVVVGYPNYRFGDTGTIHEGKITGFRNVSGIRRILVDAPIIAGNSGGPVFDNEGKVIGVAVTGSDDMESAQDTEFHSVVPINALPVLTMGSC